MSRQEQLPLNRGEHFPRSTLLTMVLRQAALLVVIGMTLGLAAMLLVTPVLKAMLYGTGSRNPVVLAGVCCWSL